MGIRYLLPREPDAEISGIQYAEGLCVFPKANRQKQKENAPEIQTSVIKGAALADRKFAIVCQKMMYSIIKTRLNEKSGEPPPKPSVIATGWKVRNICGVLPTGERQLMTATPLKKCVCLNGG